MREEGIDCDVIAVSSIARSTDDRQKKTDRKDARRLLAELLLVNPTYSVVPTPTPECEAARDLARARADAVEATKRAKQQTSALLLRHGYVWNKKTASGNLKSTWTVEHLAWIRRTNLKAPLAQETLSCYLRMVKGCIERADELAALVQRHAQSERFKPYVDALCLLQGIDVQTAFLITATIGDFTRFGSGRAVSRWIGTTPKESSSGEHEEHGSITKAGDKHVRCALMEGTATLARRKETVKRAKEGHEVPEDIAALCARANRRLKMRFDHLRKDLKLNGNKARVAIVNEMIRWIWVIGCAVQKNQARKG
jgi:transposase